MRILVTGGAGFIGSHTAKALKQAGHEPVIFDNFSKGKHFATQDLPVIEADLADIEAVRGALDGIDAVLHFAGSIEVAESVANPEKYQQNNVETTKNLLAAMQDMGVNKLIFSSTAAVYGEPQQVPIPEDHPKNPTNPYGATKWEAEALIRASGISAVCLRYFNACGADPDGELGENHDPETHLIPRAILAILGNIPPLQIFGDDYPTPDGTAIRDYVHVSDLASAHVLALDYLNNGGATTEFNVALGTGYSVKQIIDAVEKVTGKEVPKSFGPRREGDPAQLIADASRIRETLGWQPKYSDLETIVGTAWKWFSK